MLFLLTQFNLEVVVKMVIHWYCEPFHCHLPIYFPWQNSSLRYWVWSSLP